MKQYNYFWWDGGFRAVHNQPRPDLNPDGRCHVLTPRYRLDIARDRAAIVGLDASCPDAGDSLLHGEVVPPCRHALTTRLGATIDGQRLTVSGKVDERRSLMVYDSGSVAQHLRLKGVRLLREDGRAHEDAELELALVCWQDVVAVSAMLVRSDNRLPIEAGASVTLHIDGALPEGFDVQPQDGARHEGAGSFTADSHTLCVHVGPIDALGGERASVQAVRVEDDAPLPCRWSSLYAGHVVELDGFTNKAPYRVNLRAAAEETAPLRVILRREGQAQLTPTGEANPDVKRDWFIPFGSYPVGFDSADQPSGATWQVSTDGHEFANHPQPYSRRWIRLYRQASVGPDQPLDEQVRVGWSDSWARPAAQFCQLSLLGWDDNPRYGGGRNDRAVQLWCQGIVRGAEITCLCPESYMCDNIITDLRPIDQSHTWGPNLGGGDFARFRLPGEEPWRRVQAQRVDFTNYGPYLGTMRSHGTAEDERFVSVVDSSLLAANDISRAFFDCRYAFQQDFEADGLLLACLGAPSYDFTALTRYAWGHGDQVLGDELLNINAPDSQTLEPPVRAGDWVAAYRGGVVDEQHREPNGNRGLVVRRVEVRCAAMPHAHLIARRVRAARWKAPTPQWQLRLASGETEGPLRLRAGDTIRLFYEYVPVLKFAEHYGHDAHCPTYLNILKNAPDSFEPVRYEAHHGAWSCESADAHVNHDAAFPTVHVTGRTSELTLHGGSGFTPLRVVLPRRPQRLAVEQSTGDGWDDALVRDEEAPPYQLCFEEGAWVATLLLRGAPDAIDGPRMERRLRIGWE